MKTISLVIPPSGNYLLDKIISLLTAHPDDFNLIIHDPFNLLHSLIDSHCLKNKNIKIIPDMELNENEKSETKNTIQKIEYEILHREYQSNAEEEKSKLFLKKLFRLYRSKKAFKFFEEYKPDIHVTYYNYLETACYHNIAQNLNIPTAFFSYAGFFHEEFEQFDIKSNLFICNGQYDRDNLTNNPKILDRQIKIIGTPPFKGKKRKQILVPLNSDHAFPNLNNSLYQNLLRMAPKYPDYRFVIRDKPNFPSYIKKHSRKKPSNLVFSKPHESISQLLQESAICISVESTIIFECLKYDNQIIVLCPNRHHLPHCGFDPKRFDLKWNWKMSPNIIPIKLPRFNQVGLNRAMLNNLDISLMRFLRRKCGFIKPDPLQDYIYKFNNNPEESLKIALQQLLED
jgi:hypothetical protein